MSKMILFVALSLFGALLAVASPAVPPVNAQVEGNAGVQGDEPADVWLPPVDTVIGAVERERAAGRVAVPVPPAPVGLAISNDDQVELLIEVRGEMGLPSSRELVTDLMQRERAAADLREYGVVLSTSDPSLSGEARFSVSSLRRPGLL